MTPEEKVNASPYQVMSDLSAEEYASLKANIAELLEILDPVVVDENGETIDGHHRMRAKAELEAETGVRIKVSFTTVYGLSELEKRAHARRLNCLRRQLGEGEKRRLAADQLREMLEAGLNPSNREVARQLGFSDHTVEAADTEFGVRASCPTAQAAQLDKTTGADGRTRPPTAASAETQRAEVERAVLADPTQTVREIAAKTGASKSTVHNVRRHLSSVYSMNDAEYARVLAASKDLPAAAFPAHKIGVKRIERIGREYQAKERAGACDPAPFVRQDVDLRLGDFRAVLSDMADSSVDLILTDPPYPREFLPLWSDLATFAARVLKPSGLLLAYTGQFHLPTVVAALDAKLKYHWQLILHMPGAHNQVQAVRFHNQYKPILMFSRGAASPKYPWGSDVITCNKQEKDYHEWQQGIDGTDQLLARFANAGDLVVDPFLGGGTTAVAAFVRGFRFIGCDVDPVAVSRSRERLEREIEYTK